MDQFKITAKPTGGAVGGRGSNPAANGRAGSAPESCDTILLEGESLQKNAGLRLTCTIKKHIGGSDKGWQLN